MAGKSEINVDDFDQMLGTQFIPPPAALPNSIVPNRTSAGDNPLLRHQASMSSFVNPALFDNARMGDTGTTPRNEFGGLMMNRNINMSYSDLRQENNNMGISPFGQRG